MFLGQVPPPVGGKGPDTAGGRARAVVHTPYNKSWAFNLTGSGFPCHFETRQRGSAGAKARTVWGKGGRKAGGAGEGHIVDGRGGGQGTFASEGRTSVDSGGWRGGRGSSLGLEGG